MTETETKIISPTDPHLAAFEQLEQTAGNATPGWLFPLRKAGIARFAEQGFPTTKHEDWRFTNVAPIAKLPFNPVAKGVSKIDAVALEKLAFTKIESSRLVFVDGWFAPEHSNVLPQQDGVTISSLSSALSDQPELVEKHLGQYLKDDSNPFTALNTALFSDGAFIHVPQGKSVEAPVQLIFISTAAEEGATSQPRNLVVAEANSQLTVIESCVSVADGAYLTNSLTEAEIGDNAQVEHIKLQDESPEAYHIAGMHAHLGRDSRFQFNSIALGSKISRNDIRTHLDATGIEAVLNGLYLTRDKQIADHHMVVDHAKPNCDSHEYFNGILADNSKGVFHGRILVRQEAQKTDAKQTNKNLLLSDNATADAKPQLEIYADDVKCTHGATIGQLNEEAIFYLRARGIGMERARRMLMHSFAGEITDRIQHASAREELDAIVWDRLEDALPDV